jgi:hypothetical protein
MANSFKISIIISEIIMLGVFSGCKKKDETGDGWKNCYDCTAESWIGEYTGTGNYSNYTNHSNSDGVHVSILIEETAPDYLIVYFSSTNCISAVISGSLVSNYIVSFAGSGSSITATMDIMDQDLKLSGTVKKFHTEADSTMIDELINFECYKSDSYKKRRILWP